MAEINNINVNGTTYDIVDDGAMRTVSSPTADMILIDDGNGQAEDSFISISDVMTKLQVDLTARGEIITNDGAGNISSSGTKISDLPTSTDLANKQDLISNPTANKILVDSSTGQAVESSLSISDVATQSDLSGKQDTLTAGDGILISNNTISNVFDRLPNGTNLNNITYNYQGYVYNAKNAPSGVSAFGELCVWALNTDPYCIQFFSPVDKNNLYMRNYYNGVWGVWEAVKLTAGNGLNISDDTISADTTVLQSKLTAGDGISISSNTIKNQFAYLNAADLGTGNALSDDVPTNLYVGYCYNCINKPPNSSAFGWLIAVSGAGRQGQEYHDLYRNRIWYRRFYASTWNDWVRIDGLYTDGDTISSIYSTDGYIICSGVMTSASNFRFSIPVSKTIAATGFSFSKLVVQMYVNGTRVLNNIDISSSTYSKTINLNENSINVLVSLPSGTTATQYHPAIIMIREMSGTFS